MDKDRVDVELHKSWLLRYRKGCVFCHPVRALILTRSANFGVTFDVAPLAAGHLILHSREHYSCAGEVPAEQFDELERVRNYAKFLVRAVYGAVTLYEHGRVGHCLTDGPEHRLCHHYHLHLVPGNADVSDDLAIRFTQLELTQYCDLVNLYLQYGDYLYFEPNSGEMLYFLVNEEIERHFLRTLVSLKHGAPERADWRAASNASLLFEGMETIRTKHASLSTHDIL